MFNFFPLNGYNYFMLFKTIVICTIIFIILKNIFIWIKNNHSKIIEVPAKLISKRTHFSGYMHNNTMTRTKYFMTFEIQKGVRKEFKVKDDIYGLYAEGDAGVLRFQGTRFLDFKL